LHCTDSVILPTAAAPRSVAGFSTAVTQRLPFTRSTISVPLRVTGFVRRFGCYQLLCVTVTAFATVVRLRCYRALHTLDYRYADTFLRCTLIAVLPFLRCTPDYACTLLLRYRPFPITYRSAHTFIARSYSHTDSPLFVCYVWFTCTDSLPFLPVYRCHLPLITFVYRAPLRSFLDCIPPLRDVRLTTFYLPARSTAPAAAAAPHVLWFTHHTFLCRRRPCPLPLRLPHTCVLPRYRTAPPRCCGYRLLHVTRCHFPFPDKHSYRWITHAHTRFAVYLVATALPGLPLPPALYTGVALLLFYRAVTPLDFLHLALYVHSYHHVRRSVLYRILRYRWIYVYLYVLPALIVHRILQLHWILLLRINTFAATLLVL